MEVNEIEDIKKRATKRARSENWLEEDKIILKELVKERVSVLENKNTDTNTNSRKVAAWNDLTNSFNCMCKGAQRTIVQLKSQWGQMKMIKKKKNAQERKNIFKTGGGPPPVITPDSFDDIGAWLPNEFMVDSNEFDSDQIPHVQRIQTNKEIIKKKDELLPVYISVNNDVELVQAIPESAVQYAATPENKKKSDEVEPIEIRDTPVQNAPKSAKKTKKNKKKQTPAERIAAVEIRCRKELHKAQMQNENMNKENLESQNELIKLKLHYFRQKLNNME